MSRGVALSVLSFSLLVVACESRPRVLDQRGAGHTRAVSPDDHSGQPATRTAPDDDTPSPGAAGADLVEVVTEPAEEVDAELDLALRVKNAYGYPAECLGPGAVAEGLTEFAIRLTVTMTGTGVVTRSSVSAPVNAEARACLEARAAGLRVAGPVPDAPATVSTSIDVRAVPRLAATEPLAAPTAAYVPPGARPASTTLPAVVGDGPAPGARPASTTLPAVVGDGPAPGARPATVTLPAQGSDGRDWEWINGSAEGRGEVADRAPE
jgi:hypothetical protein